MKKHKVPESERQAIIGNLFAHFDLASVAREPASALDSEKRHLLAIAAALSFSPAALVADEPTKGLDEVASARVAKALFSYDKQVVFASHATDLIVRPEYAIGRVLVVEDTPIRRLRSFEVPAPYPRTRACLTEPRMLELRENLISLLRREVSE